jgi:hypothetical protein
MKKRNMSYLKKISLMTVLLFLTVNRLIPSRTVHKMTVVDQTQDIDTTSSDTSYVNISTSEDTVTIYWRTPELNTCMESTWDGYLSSDTFYVTMTDTGMLCDCVNHFILTVRFISFQEGSYILDFWNWLYDYPSFTISYTSVNDTLLTSNIFFLF